MQFPVKVFHVLKLTTLSFSVSAVFFFLVLSTFLYFLNVQKWLKADTCCKMNTQRVIQMHLGRCRVCGLDLDFTWIDEFAFSPF